MNPFRRRSKRDSTGSLHNQWKHGKTQLVCNPLPATLLGHQGVSFERAIFDKAVGSEIFLQILEIRHYADEIGGLGLLDLYCKSGIVRTRVGPLAFNLWTLSNRGRHIVDYEHYVNVFEPALYELLNTLSRQDYLKVVIRENLGGEVCGFYELKNDYGFEKTGESLKDFIKTSPPVNFEAAKIAFQDEFSVQDLKKL